MRCDATYARDGAGREGYLDAIVESGTPDGATCVSLPVGECSEDRVQVWHGMDTPAISCGRHATSGIGGGPVLSVFRGHRNRVAEVTR